MQHFSKDSIEIKEIVEMISEVICLYDYKCNTSIKEFNRITPTLQSRIALTYNLCGKVSFDGKFITFDAKGQPIKRIYFFNYLVLFSDNEINNIENFKMGVFDSYENMKEFLLEEFHLIHKIYVKDVCFYSPAFYRFYYFDDTKNEKILADNYSVHYRYDSKSKMVCNTRRRNRDFQILGVCEFHTQDDIWCTFAHSWEEIELQMDSKMIFYEVKFHNYLKEDGTLFFEGVNKSYRIFNSKNGGSVKIYD